MKIIVLYNLVTAKFVGNPEDILADQDTVKTARTIAENLDAELFEVKESNIKELEKLKPDLFFNNAFGIGSVPKSEADLAAILESLKIPFTGSGSRAILLTTDKRATKEVLKAGNLPIPKDKKYPLIVKPADEDCSLGIYETSVVSNKNELDKQVEQLRQTYDEDVLVEEYIDGRELNVTVLGNGEEARALPISEIIFGPSYKNKYKIVDFAAKWKEKSVNYRETVGVCPADLPASLTANIQELAVAAFVATGCCNYARVDFRLSKDNKPFILEVNANPGIGPADGATRSAKAHGFSYGRFLEAIVQMALMR